MSGGLHQRYLGEALGQIPRNKGVLKSTWRCPSNIALVKYWGKKPGQIPANPSLSFTLSNSYTETELTLRSHAGDEGELEYLFEGEQNGAFESRIRGYLRNISPYFPFLSGCKIRIESRNTFPHSSGIASSASSMGALALGICSIEKLILDGSRDVDFYRKASYMARLGSGSAARSVYGGFVTWGKQEGLEHTSDEFASPMSETAGPAFTSLHDAVLIISPDTKSISSRQGHALMNEHPYASARYSQARKNIMDLHKAIIGNDLKTFIQITENEAFVLHGMMMSSDPAFLLMKPGTLEVISRIQQFRKEKGIPVAFTLDAGPNVHLIYPGSEREKVLAFIRDELLGYCHQEHWIDDRMGGGPEELSIGPDFIA
jgi:diphosphomevalonate decarboxylase